MKNKLVEMIQKKEMEYRLQGKKDRNRMEYHLMPPVGWLNDPNGLCQFQGEYHVFFQYAPFYPENGTKAWGHYVSKDLINWDYRGVPILPDTDWDKDGAYSGCALVEDGKMEIFYTGNTKEKGDYDYILEGRGANTLYLCSEDGKNFSPKECLMTNADYPSDYTCHVRDPKVWKEGDTYYMVQGGRKIGDFGAVIVFSSKNKKDWNVAGEITTKEVFGYMWECPDYFVLDGTKILGCCPQGLQHEEYRYQNVHQSGYFELEGNLTGECTLGEFKEWDMGFDFYAPQTFEAEDGRRIMIGWVGLPDAEYGNKEIEDGWIHCMTLPRELHYENGRVYAYPVEEIKKLRKEQVNLCDVKEELLSYEWELKFDVEKSGKKEVAFSLAEGVTLQYKEAEEELQLCMSVQAGDGRKLRKLKLSKLTSLHIFVDHSVVEIYVNHGEYVFTSRFYSDKIIPTQMKAEGVKVTSNLWKLREK